MFDSVRQLLQKVLTAHESDLIELFFSRVVENSEDGPKMALIGKLPSLTKQLGFVALQHRGATGNPWGQ